MINPDVRSALSRALYHGWTIWTAITPVDLRKVTRPETSSSYAIMLEQYRGVQSSIEFSKRIETDLEICALDNFLREKQPELVGYASCRDLGLITWIRNAASLIGGWCDLLERHTSNGSTLQNAIEKILHDADAVLKSQTLDVHTLSPIAGLEIADGISPVELERGVTLHRLTQQDIVDIGSHDVLDQPRLNVVQNRISSALTIATKVNFNLTKDPPVFDGEAPLHAQHARILNTAIQALHILKHGHASVAATYTKFAPDAFPQCRRGSMHPLYTNPFSHLAIQTDEVERLQLLYNALLTAGDDVRLAASRLSDAAGRLSPVDALLDAVIGIECLLNQGNSTELSFRVSLNYAFLAPSADRRSRYDLMRAIYNSRSAIVHSGKGKKSRQPDNITEQSNNAKACLRDILQRVLTDETLKHENRDPEFWLRRLMPDVPA